MDGEVDRISWPDGTWWECYKEMPYGVRRKSRRLMAPYIKADTATQQMIIDETNFDATVLDDLQMVKLLGCTAAWSWDEEEITEETIEKKPTGKVETVVERMAVLYNEDEVETTKGAKKRTSSSSTSQ